MTIKELMAEIGGMLERGEIGQYADVWVHAYLGGNDYIRTSAVKCFVDSSGMGKRYFVISECKSQDDSCQSQDG